ncbi:MAG: TonB-dependent receptor [Candidatus Eremiobacteraeota bacterium]|nr:TonB-dependent receptor [Candidatus Eremiobacteraeota bacterium]
MTSPILARTLCAAFFICALSAPAAAQTTATPTPSPLPEIVRVVTSDRSEETLTNAARTTYVITKSDMVARGYRSVGDALAHVPGVNLERYGATGAAASFGIRGSSGSQVLVLINGLPAPGAQINNVDLDNIPTSGVDRIEVVEGGGSTLYGAGSIGGIINIITPQMPAAALISAFAGSFGQRGFSIETRNVSFSQERARNDFSLPGNPSRTNADSEQTSGRVAFARQMGAIGATFSAGMTDHHLGDPGPDGFLSPTSRQFSVDEDAHLILAHRARSAVTTLELGGSHQMFAFTCHTAVDFNCANYPFTPGAPVPDSFAQLLAEGRVEANVRNVVTHESSRTIYGIDLSRGVARVDDGGGDTASDPLQIHAFAKTAAFVQQDWTSRNGARLYAGLRAERDGSQGGALSPSVGAVVRLARELSFKVNAATAFRAPTADDLYYPGFSNPSLQVERTRVADASLVDSAILGGASLTWFSTSGTNLIVLDGKFVPQNVGHASIAGLTFAVQTVPRKGYYAKIDATNLYRAADLDTDPALDFYAGSRLPGRGPVFSGNLELGFAGAAGATIANAALVAHIAGDRGSVDRTQPLFDQPAAYTSVDAFVRFRLDTRALLSLRAYNIGNERYGEIGGFPRPGRSFVAELSTR